MACGRSFGGNTAFRIDSVAGMTNAAPEAHHHARRDQHAGAGRERRRRAAEGEHGQPADSESRRP